jgi:hypothetical protein
MLATLQWRFGPGPHFLLSENLWCPDLRIQRISGTNLWIKRFWREAYHSFLSRVYGYRILVVHKRTQAQNGLPCPSLTLPVVLQQKAWFWDVWGEEVTGVWIKLHGAELHNSKLPYTKHMEFRESSLTLCSILQKHQRNTGTHTYEYIYIYITNKQTNKQTSSVALSCERTIPTERPLFVGEVSAYFGG